MKSDYSRLMKGLFPNVELSEDEETDDEDTETETRATGDAETRATGDAETRATGDERSFESIFHDLFSPHWNAERS